MAVDPKLAFSGMREAKQRIDANYERPGHYIERIERLRLDKTRKDEVFVAIEKTVLVVFDEALDQQKPPGTRGHRVGEPVTHMLMKKHDLFLGNLKSFIAAVMGVDPNDVTEEHAMQICDASQPLAGTCVEVKNRSIVTKKDKDFTAINYQREVPASELLTLPQFPPELQARFFPNGLLQRLAEAEAAHAAQTSGQGA